MRADSLGPSPFVEGDTERGLRVMGEMLESRVSAMLAFLERLRVRSQLGRGSWFVVRGRATSWSLGQAESCTGSGIAQSQPGDAVAGRKQLGRQQQKENLEDRHPSPTLRLHEPCHATPRGIPAI